MTSEPTSLSDKAPSDAYVAMDRFAREHAPATKLLHVATEDYAAARCLLQNRLFDGLILGAQTIEKYLKAYLLLLNPKANVRQFKHSLPLLFEQVNTASPQAPFAAFVPLIKRFNSHYQVRYPDNPNTPAAMTTADRIPLDEFIVLLNEHLPCPITVKYRTGLYAAITFSLGLAKTVTPKEYWIKYDNRALAPLLPDVEANYRHVTRSLWPSVEI